MDDLTINIDELILDGTGPNDQAAIMSGLRAALPGRFGPGLMSGIGQALVTALPSAGSADGSRDEDSGLGTAPR
jgi:hypothetical protein